MGTFKQKRCRKTWDPKTLRLRIQDAMEALEPVFIGKEGKDYDIEKLQLQIKTAHAYSQLINTARKVIETDELEKRIKKLEEANED